MAREGIESARELGVERQWGDFLRGEVAGRLMQIGRWTEAEELLEEVIDRSPTGVTAHSGVSIPRATPRRAGRIRRSGARAGSGRSTQMRRSLGSMALAPPAAARITLELWAGRPQAAAALAIGMSRPGDGQGVAVLHGEGVRPRSACVRRPRRSRARRRAGAGEQAARAAAAARAAGPADRRANGHRATARSRQPRRLRGRAFTDRSWRRPFPVGGGRAAMGDLREPVLTPPTPSGEEPRRCSSPAATAPARRRSCKRRTRSLMTSARGLCEQSSKPWHAALGSTSAGPERSDAAPGSSAAAARAHAARARGSGPARRRADQPRDRRRAVHQRQDRERARVADPQQALGPQPSGSRRGRAAARHHAASDATCRLRRVAASGVSSNRRGLRNVGRLRLVYELEPVSEG